MYIDFIELSWDAKAYRNFHRVTIEMKVWHNQNESTKSENQRCLMAEIISFEEENCHHVCYTQSQEFIKNNVDFKSK